MNHRHKWMIKIANSGCILLKAVLPSVSHPSLHLTRKVSTCVWVSGFDLLSISFQGNLCIDSCLMGEASARAVGGWSSRRSSGSRAKFAVRFLNIFLNGLFVLRKLTLLNQAIFPLFSISAPSSTSLCSHNVLQRVRLKAGFIRFRDGNFEEAKELFREFSWTQVKNVNVQRWKLLQSVTAILTI